VRPLIISVMYNVVSADSYIRTRIWRLSNGSLSAPNSGRLAPQSGLGLPCVPSLEPACSMTHFGLSLKREKCAGSCKQPKLPRPGRPPPASPRSSGVQGCSGRRPRGISRRETRSASSPADLLNLKQSRDAGEREKARKRESERESASQHVLHACLSPRASVVVVVVVVVVAALDALLPFCGDPPRNKRGRDTGHSPALSGPKH